MLRGPLIHSRCRHVCFSGRLDQWMSPIGPTTFKRYRSKPSGFGEKSNFNTARRQWSDEPFQDIFNFRQDTSRPLENQRQAPRRESRYRWINNQIEPEETTTQRVVPKDVIPFFENTVTEWSQADPVSRRLKSYGIRGHDVAPLIKAFVKAVSSGELSSPETFDFYGLSRFSQDFADDGFNQSIDAIYTTILFRWASEPRNKEKLLSIIKPSTLSHIEALTRAANTDHPEEEFTLARSMRRKIIMHVGPTNSGKTHNALRALAAAGTGVYAGPLRLLAHEIWERLNLGQIVPLGAEEGHVLAKRPRSDSNTALDVPPKAKAIQQHGNPGHARKCNMLTGEEQKIVDNRAGLLSCTVEMLPYSRIMDVAVIDEIQMIGDPDRGSAWTSAVLGFPAKEVHLCGEETTVPLVQKLLESTGDELIVNRYQRLSPLSLGESLDGDLREVKKGDCIVTFSRNSIFALKHKIESQTPMRCAVVYGRLPPETRSEQAALFNDPDSGYDVLLGSDAIGMGLNLKIRRVIFEAVSKFDGAKDRFLSISQTKQIAGRAGRFGLHGKDTIGLATTLLKKDLSFLRETMAKIVPDLEVARLLPTPIHCVDIAATLPQNSPTSTIFSSLRYLAIPPSEYRFSPMGTHEEEICKFIDKHAAGLTLRQRLTYIQAPLPKLADPAINIIARLIDMHDKSMDVRLTDALEGTNLIDTLENVEISMEEQSFHRNLGNALRSLESLHKAIVAYVWLSYRQPLVYNQHAEVIDLKRRVEKALDWSLQELTKDQPLRGVRRDSYRPSIEYVNRREARLTPHPEAPKKPSVLRRAMAGVSNS